MVVVQVGGGGGGGGGGGDGVSSCAISRMQCRHVSG